MEFSSIGGDHNLGHRAHVIFGMRIHRRALYLTPMQFRMNVEHLEESGYDKGTDTGTAFTRVKLSLMSESLLLARRGYRYLKCPRHSL